MLRSLLGMLGLMWSANAATFDGPALELDELMAYSESVVVGEVRSKHAVDGGPGIETIVEVRVTETFQGTPAPVVEIRIPGGELDGLVLTVSGAPQLEIGESVVVFVDEDNEVVGFNQGLFHIQGDIGWSDGGDAMRVLPYEELRRELR